MQTTVSVSVAWDDDRASTPGVGHRHHLCEAAGRFAYLVAMLDWFSRYVLAWELAPSLDTLHCLRVLEVSLAQAGSAACADGFDGGQDVHCSATFAVGAE